MSRSGSRVVISAPICIRKEAYHRPAKKASAILLVTLAFFARPSRAQWQDDFSDGDFSVNPAWVGSVDKWSVTRTGADFFLQTNGDLHPDTLTLATASSIAAGRWSFTFTYTDVNLSTANGARIFLVADTEALHSSVKGYFLQLGTNNSDEIRLYRQDGDAATKRHELCRSDPITDSTSGTIRFSVTRNTGSVWQVYADGILVCSAADPTYSTSRFFGLWVKHSTETGKSFSYDDFVIEAPVADSPPAEPGDVVINEILYEPHPGETEFIELYNTSANVIDACELRIADGTSAWMPVCTLSALIEPLEWLVLVQDSLSFHIRFPTVRCIQPPKWPALNNDGDSVRLQGVKGVIDAVTFRTDWHSPFVADRQGVSLERRSPAHSSVERTSWTSSVAPSGATPGAVNSVVALPNETNKDVIVTPNPFSPDSDGMDDAATIRYHLDDLTAFIRVRIFDSAGRIVRTLEAGGLSGPTGQIGWDGFGVDGRSLPVGIYVVLFEAFAQDGSIVSRRKLPVVLARHM